VTPTSEEIAWAAGLFEGEGSISLMQQRGRKSVGVIMHMGSTDPDVTARFHAIVGVGNVTIRDRPDPRHKRVWVWQSAAIDDVRHVARLLAPWLGARRSSRLHEVIAAYEAAPARRISKTHCPQGHEFTAENTLRINGKHRRCRECNKVAQRKQTVRRKAEAWHGQIEG
jgi:hypothetical protein